ncbi:MAG: S8 family serine peptidase [Myxococcota bacterium]
MSPRRIRRVRRAGQWARGLERLVAGLVLALISGSALRASAEAEPCGPFEADGTRIVQLAADRTLRDPGVQAAGAGAGGPGSIVPLPDGGGASGTAGGPGAGGAGGGASGSSAAGVVDPAARSEALLALPKTPAGGLPTDFELGRDAKIAQSFFSPVICATVARITGPPGSTLDELVTVVPETGIVVPNDVYASAAAEVQPAPAAPGAADPYAPLQYGLALSGVRAARELGAGEGVRIALLDSAPDVAHRDLAPSRIEAVATEPKGGPKPQPAVHGTLMAGVIGAAEGNGFGIAGLAPRARIVSIPVCTANGGAGGQCTIYQMLQGFDRAYDAKASIVNLSLSGPPNPLLERGVARLEALGLVVVAAAGNEGRSDKRYPAAYPSVIGVGAVDREGRRFATSNHGRWVELYAPGVEILSTVPGSAFAFGSGTSLAAAHVTGSLAVLTGITGDARRARSALFRTVNARSGGGLPLLPPACDVLGGAGRPCAAAKR